MTRNEILEIVNQFYGSNASEREIAFARFVMAKEREACARECEIQALDGVFAPDDLADAIRARGEK